MNRMPLVLVSVLLATFVVTATRLRAADMKAAAQNYADSCAGCHGASGHGDGKDAATLKTKPGDFTDCSRMAKFSDDQLFNIVKNGGQAAGEGPDMPAYSEGYGDNEIHDLVTYVRQFCKK
jgi:high-affinity iron transporter